MLWLDRFHHGSTLPFLNDLGMDSAPLSHLRKCWWTKPRTELSVILMHCQFTHLAYVHDMCYMISIDIPHTHTHPVIQLCYCMSQAPILSYGVCAKFAHVDWLFMTLTSFAWSAHRVLCHVLWTTQDTWKWQATVLFLGAILSTGGIWSASQCFGTPCQGPLVQVCGSFAHRKETAVHCLILKAEWQWEYWDPSIANFWGRQLWRRSVRSLGAFHGMPADGWGWVERLQLLDFGKCHLILMRKPAIWM